MLNNRNILLVMLCCVTTTGLESKNPFRRGLIKKVPTWNKQNQEIVHELWHNVHEVEAGKLYRTHQLDASTLAHFMKKYGIKTVINLRGQQPGVKWWQQEQAAVLAHGAQYFNLPMSAMAMTPKWILQKMLHIFDTAPQPIMIHCQGGADRTGEAAAIWRLEKMHGTKKQALADLSWRYGHIACPNKDKLIQMWGGRDWLENDYHVGEDSTLVELVVNEEPEAVPVA